MLKRGVEVEFRLLGPLEVRSGESALALGGVKQRALLALLLLHPNEVVSRDRLIDELWGELSPRTSGHRLDNQVSRLRKTLELGEALVTRVGGYALEVDPLQIDAHRFERLLEQGRRESAAGEPTEAADTLRQALELWRGGALADLAYQPFARVEIERLEELRVAAIEERIDADLALGGHHALVSELEALTARHPLRERLRGQLMLALYRSGRQAEALAIYTKTRRRLVEELGIEPTSSLKDLERAILAHDPSLDAPGPAIAEFAVEEHMAAPPAGTVFVGHRSELGTLGAVYDGALHRLVGFGPERRVPALRMPRRRAHNIPVPATPLIGRAAELARVVEMVDESRMVTLVGPGGVGKTRLGLAVARERIGRHRDGVWLAELAASCAEDVEQLVAGLFDVLPVPGNSLRQAIVEHLADRDILLVLDNAEHVADSLGALVPALLTGTPEVSLLLTSRTPLHVDGEHVVAVEALSVPELPTREAVACSGAGELFLKRASAAGGDTASAPAVARICRALDGLPLAIEIAAAHTRVLDVGRIAELVETRPTTLTSPMRDLPARHRSIEATLSWSVALLSPAERLLFERLTVFAEPRELDDVLSVCAYPPLDEASAMSTLAPLVDQSLVKRFETGAGVARYGLLQTVRSFAASRLQRDADVRTLAARHREWLTARLTGGHNAPVAEVALAVRGAVASGEHDDALRLTLGMAPTWRFTHPFQGLTLLRQALAGRTHDDALQGEAQRTLAELEYFAGDARAANGCSREAIRIFEALGDDTSLGRALAEASRFAHALGEEATARAWATRALTLLCDGTAVDAEIRAHLVLIRLGDYRDLVAALRCTAERARAGASPWMLFETLRILGEQLLLDNRLDEASEVTDEAAAVAALIATPHSDCLVLCLRGTVALARHDPAAGELFEAALRLAHEAGITALAAYALERGAAAATLDHDFEHAARLLGTADRERERSGTSRHPDDRVIVERVRRAVESALSASAFATLREEGRKIDVMPQ